MKFQAGVRWPRQAAASKDTYLHVEVAPIFLRDQVRRRFRSAKKRMQRLIDPAGLADTRKIFHPRVVVPLLRLFEWNLIRRIAINLIRTQKYEHRLWRMQPRGFQKVHRAKRVHLEIDQRNLARLIVRRLRGAVDDQIKALRSKQLLDGCPVANVQRRVREPLGHALQPLQIPERIACRAEKDPPHVVVYPDDFMPVPVEMLHRFRSDQSAAPSDKNFHLFESIPLYMSRKSKKSGGLAANRVPEKAAIGEGKAASSLEEYQQSSGFLTAPVTRTRLRPRIMCPQLQENPR